MPPMAVCKMLYERLGALRPSTWRPAIWWTATHRGDWVHLDLRPDDLLSGGLQPTGAIGCTSTFDLATCYLVDCNPQGRLDAPRPSTWRPAIWWTATHRGDWMHLNLRPGDLLSGGLQPTGAIGCTSTFDLATCYLVDCNPQGRLGAPRPSTWRPAIWWTATHRGDWVHLDLRPGDLLSGGLQPTGAIGCTSTFDLATCYLVDCNPQGRLGAPRPSTWRPAIWWTATHRGDWVHLDLRPDDLLSGGLQPTGAIGCTSTFDLATCYLVDCNPQGRLGAPRPSTWRPAIWWTATHRGDWVHLDLRPDDLLSGGLQPTGAIGCTSTFDLTTCYLVDCNPLERLGAPRPSTWRPAIWWTATHRGDWVHLDLRPGDLLSGGLQPTGAIGCTSTFDLATCYLVDCNPLERLDAPRPST